MTQVPLLSVQGFTIADLALVAPGPGQFLEVGGATEGRLDIDALADYISTARGTLQLGTLATQSAASVAITGGSIAGITDLAIADGGTGASTAENARTNLGAAPLASPTFTGTVTASATTASTSTTTGALVVTGGLGVGGNLTVGQDIQLLNNAALTTNNSSATFSLYAGGTFQGGRIDFFGGLAAASTGSLVFRSGVGGTGQQPERMRIDGAGNIGIGTSTPSTLLHVNGTIRYSNRPTAATITALGFDANGDIRASSSSLRYKHDVEDLKTGLNEVMQLRPVSFKFNGEARTNMGFIAEEVDELGLSDVMLYNEEKQPEGVIYSNMVSLLTKAIQEQQAQIEDLKNEVNLLKGT